MTVLALCVAALALVLSLTRERPAPPAIDPALQEASWGREGATAFAIGHDLANCPYEFETAAYTFWAGGWYNEREAQFARGKPKP